jgi:hypothetical protein
MKSNDLRIKQAKGAILIFSIIVMLLGAFIQQGEAQFGPYYPPAFPYYGGFPPVAPPPFYGYSPYGYLPTRSASVVLPTTTLLTTLLAPTTTTVAAPIIGISTAITLATLGGTGLSATALVALSTTPVPTVTTTPTIGVTTALLLSGGVSTTTLLLLGI